MSNPDDPMRPPGPPGGAPEPSYPRAPAGPSGPRATFGLRFVGWLVDFIILGVLGLVLRGLLGVPAGSGVSLLVNFAYFGFFEGGPAGQTPGKRVAGIRVIRFDTAGELGWGVALVRNVCRIISAIPCGLGYLWMLWDPEKQTWHDKLSNTVVVPVAAYPPPPNSFAQPPRS